MLKALAKLLIMPVCRTLNTLSPAAMARLHHYFAQAYIESKPPRAALTFLFELDQHLYHLQGRMAQAYGGGVHTKHRHMNYHDFFCRKIQAGQTVLDVGCGIGAVAWDVAEKCGARVTGIEISPKNIEQARAQFQHPRVTYICGDALHDLPAEQFDVIILSNVLEHIEHRVAFLKKIAASAAPARFLIRVPLFERDWRVPLKKELGLEYRLDNTHFIEYTQESFRAEMAAAKLSIIDCEVRWGEIWCELRNQLSRDPVPA